MQGVPSRTVSTQGFTPFDFLDPFTNAVAGMFTVYAFSLERGLTELDQNLKRLLPETGLPSMLQVVHLAWK